MEIDFKHLKKNSQNVQLQNLFLNESFFSWRISDEILNWRKGSIYLGECVEIWKSECFRCEDEKSNQILNFAVYKKLNYSMA